MQPTHKAATLRLYAVLLLCIGLASIFYNPQTGQMGYHSAGLSGLYSTGSGAILAFVFSIYAAKFKDWAHYAGAILCFMFLIMGFKNGFVTARALTAGTEPPHHWYKAALFGATAFVSLVCLMPLLIYIRREQPSDS